MYLCMEYRLPCDLTAVPTDVKTSALLSSAKSREKNAAGQPILTHVYRFKPGAWPSGSGVQKSAMARPGPPWQPLIFGEANRNTALAGSCPSLVRNSTPTMSCVPNVQ